MLFGTGGIPPGELPRSRVTYSALAISAKSSINYLVNVINKNMSNQPEWNFSIFRRKTRVCAEWRRGENTYSLLM
jgi:hypothetical protein